jgi:hypothetical protein
MEFFLTQGVLSVNTTHAVGWKRWLEDKAPRQLASIRRLTLAGQANYAFFCSDMPELQNAFPHIEELGIQVQMGPAPWVNMLIPGTVDTRWRNWEPANWASGNKIYGTKQEMPFGRHVTFVFEGTIWLRGLNASHFLGQSEPRDVQEQQLVVRIIREGKLEGDEDEDEEMGGTGWTDEDVKIEVLQPGGLVEPKRTANWRMWWRGNLY